MAYIKIDSERCKGCNYCIMFCSKGLIKKSKKLNNKGFVPALASKGKCSGCTMCAIICPECAIEVYK